jgi:hypothetical protein
MGSSHERDEPRQKDHQADHDGADSANQHGAGRHVFGLLDAGMEFRGRDIAKKLERGIQRLSGPHGNDGENQQRPLPALESGDDTGDADE